MKLIILVILLAIFAMLVCYSALVVAIRADEWEREYWERREDDNRYRYRP